MFLLDLSPLEEGMDRWPWWRFLIEILCSLLAVAGLAALLFLGPGWFVASPVRLVLVLGLASRLGMFLAAWVLLVAGLISFLTWLHSL